MADVLVPMTLSDLWPGFQGHDIFWSRISEKTAKLIEWYQVCRPWLTAKRVARVCQHELNCCPSTPGRILSTDYALRSEFWNYLVICNSFIFFRTTLDCKSSYFCTIFTARCYEYMWAVFALSRCPSVCLSVCHVRVLYSDGWRYHQTSFCVRYR